MLGINASSIILASAQVRAWWLPIMLLPRQLDMQPLQFIVLALIDQVW